MWSLARWSMFDDAAGVGFVSKVEHGTGLYSYLSSIGTEVKLNYR